MLLFRQRRLAAAVVVVLVTAMVSAGPLTPSCSVCAADCPMHRVAETSEKPGCHRTLSTDHAAGAPTLKAACGYEHAVVATAGQAVLSDPPAVLAAVHPMPRAEHGQPAQGRFAPEPTTGPPRARA